jgi:hypothetical protein
VAFSRLVLIGLVALAVAPGAALAQTAKLTLVEPESLTLATEGGSAPTQTVWVRNSNPELALVTFSAEVVDSDGIRHTIEAGSSPRRIGANEVQAFRVTLKDIPGDGKLNGELVARASGVRPGSIDLELGPNSDFTSLLNILLVVPAIVAAAFVLLRYFTLKGHTGVGLGSRLGTVDFDFSKSFASTITVVGAVLGTVLTASVLPEEPELLSKQQYTALNLVFGAMIVLAGVVYAATEAPAKNSTPTPGEERKYEGFVWSFLLATGLVMWAVLGELACLLLIVSELDRADLFTTSAIVVFIVLMVTAALAILFYAFRRMHWIVEHKAAMTATIDRQTVTQETESWPLL